VTIAQLHISNSSIFKEVFASQHSQESVRAYPLSQRFGRCMLAVPMYRATVGLLLLQEHIQVYTEDKAARSKYM
jgi:hypothetical protein